MNAESTIPYKTYSNCFGVDRLQSLLPYHTFKAAHLERRSMSSGLDIPSGRIRGMAATHVLNKSILGFLSPLKRQIEQSVLRFQFIQFSRSLCQIKRFGERTCPHVIMSSGSLFNIWALVIIMQRPTSLSRCLRMLSIAFRT